MLQFGVLVIGQILGHELREERRLDELQLKRSYASCVWSSRVRAWDAPSPRHEFFYWSDDGSLVALRYDNWKIVFQEQRSHGFDVWQDPFTPLRLPKIFNLRSDPFEEGDRIGLGYGKWRIDRTFVLVPAQQIVGQFISTFKEYPPSQKVGTFSLDQVLAKLSEGSGGQ